MSGGAGESEGGRNLHGPGRGSGNGGRNGPHTPTQAPDLKGEKGPLTCENTYFAGPF